MKKTIIISGGEKGGLEFAFSYRAEEFSDTYIIACDKGYKYASEEGIRPDLIVGDFDSYNGTLPGDVPIERLPVEKDDTDTMHAIREALDRKSDLIIICCALGGRLDHLLSNIQCAHFAAARGVNTVIAGDDTTVYVFKDDKLTLKKDPNVSLSVLSLSDKSVVSISGTKYVVTNATITSDYPLGQSNEWEKEEAQFEAKAGTIAVITSGIKK